MYCILAFNIYKTHRQKVLHIANYSYKTFPWSLFFSLNLIKRILVELAFGLYIIIINIYQEKYPSLFFLFHEGLNCSKLH